MFGVNDGPDLPDAARLLIDAGHQAPSADNSQPWHFWIYPDHIELSYDRPRLSGRKTFGPDHHPTYLAMGAVIENMAQAAEAADISGFAWHHLHPPLDNLRLRIDFDPNSSLTKSLADHPLFNRHTNRGTYFPTSLRDDIISAVEPMAEGRARLLVLTDRRSLNDMAKLINKASEVRFQTREIHEWLGDSLRFTSEEALRGDGLDVATLNLPPGGKFVLKATKEWAVMAMLNVLNGYRFFAAVEAKAIYKAPALVAIIGPADKEESVLAGRLMERVWIELNKQGVAVQPYYVLPDQMERLSKGLVPVKLRRSIQEVAEQTNNMLGLAMGERLQMLLRIGLPQGKTVRSRRLPLSSVCTLQCQ